MIGTVERQSTAIGRKRHGTVDTLDERLRRTAEHSDNEQTTRRLLRTFDGVVHMRAARIERDAPKANLRRWDQFDAAILPKLTDLETLHAADRVDPRQIAA